jgi:mannose-1-phosphate guanylyltransferase
MMLDPERIVLVTPSDHLIKEQSEYERVVARANILAKEGYLVTFGIVPTSAETGYGYIECDDIEIEMVKGFHEKPDIETAELYLKSGKHYWNSGMFCFKAGVFLEELAKYSPEIFIRCKSAIDNADSSNIIRIKLEDMISIPDESIDYAVMEKSDRIKVLKSDIRWSDIGSFDALYNELPKDVFGNTIYTKHISIESHNNLVLGENRSIATIDVDDLIIVDAGDAILVSKKGSSQKVRQVITELKKDNTDLNNTHQTVYRPWGTYSVLEENNNYKIKRVIVMPGKRLSLQKHLHRSEHWTVVSGNALIQIGQNEMLLNLKESTYIPAGEIHRLSNIGEVELILIEVQVGDYLGEDDIVRFKDDYQRG